MTSYSLLSVNVTCWVAKSCPTLQPTDYSTPDFPVLHYLLEFAQVHIHWVGDAIQPSHPLPLPSPFCRQSLPASASIFSNELALHIRWPKDWSISISPSSDCLLLKSVVSPLPVRRGLNFPILPSHVGVTFISSHLLGSSKPFAWTVCLHMWNHLRKWVKARFSLPLYTWPPPLPTHVCFMPCRQGLWFVFVSLVLWSEFKVVFLFYLVVHNTSFFHCVLVCCLFLLPQVGSCGSRKNGEGMFLGGVFRFLCLAACLGQEASKECMFLEFGRLLHLVTKCSIPSTLIPHKSETSPIIFWLFFLVQMFIRH